MRRSRATTSPVTRKTKTSSRRSATVDASVREGIRVLDIEARAVLDLKARLDERFARAVTLLYECQGKVVISGMGKSGLRVPAAEGVHGDLGMLARRDVLIAISNSGETQEVLQLLPFVKRMNVPVVGMTGKMNSTLAKTSDVTLDVSVNEEACPLGLAPTASTTATLAMGDALAVALLQKRGFKHDDFAQFHPGGSLGRRLLVKVRDLMHQEAQLPRVRADVSGADTILEMTSKKLGLTTVVNTKGALYGIVTDGDLRRFIQGGGDFSKVTAADLASRHPKTIGPDELATTAVALMEQYSITALVVIEPPHRLAGVIHLHDLLKHGIV